MKDGSLAPEELPENGLLLLLTEPFYKQEAPLGQRL